MHRAQAPMPSIACGLHGSATPRVLNGSPQRRNAAPVRSLDGSSVAFLQHAGGGSIAATYYNSASRRDLDVANGQIDEERKVGIECQRATPILA
jgi:hypothetical protein